MYRQPDSKPTVTIKNWYFGADQLSGNAFGHPRFNDGQFVVTSTVISVLKDAEDVFLVETMNTNYLIEPPPSQFQREQFEHLPIKEDQ